MKFFGSLILFIVLLGSALAENRIEFHSDNTDIETHSHAHQNESNKSDPHSDCDHYHMHCINLCLGILFSAKQILTTPQTYLAELQFNQPLLLIKDFSISLYRPPIF